jgi:C4-dicarboxylate transporter DctM subunit
MLVGTIFIVVLLSLLLLGLPVAFALAIAGFAGLTYVSGLSQALAIVYMTPYSAVASWLFIVVPLFILMGHFAGAAGMVEKIFNVAHKCVGHIRGGLAIATVVANAFFGAASGSSLAAVAVFGKVAIPEMGKYGYQPKLAIGTVCCAGTLAALIPPSIGFVLYGILTERSISKLLIAGIMPGLLTAAMLILLIWIKVKINPQLAPTIQHSVIWRERLRSLTDIWPLLILILAVMGSIYAGLATPTEAAAVGALSAFLIGLVSRRIGFAGLKDSLLETAYTTGVLFTIIIGAQIFTRFLTISRFSQDLTSFITGSNIPPPVVLCCIYGIYLLLGCFLDPMGLMLVTVPIVYPIAVTSLGYDPIWFGVMVVKLIELGMITPPVGMHLYILKGLFPAYSVGEIFEGSLHFVLIDLVTVTLLTLFPQISLWLPARM